MFDKAGFTCIFHGKGHPVRVRGVERQHLVRQGVQQARDYNSGDKLREKEKGFNRYVFLRVGESARAIFRFSF